MTAFQIRAGLSDDLAGVVALERITPETPHWAEAEYAAAISADESGYVRRCLFTAEAEGVLIGFSVGRVVGEVGELESVAVDIRSRRCGVGRTLCEAVINWCKRMGAIAVELEVRAGSEGAIGLYRVLGFVPVGRRPEYYSAPLDDAVLMRLDLC
jgi:ribosomal-protein-alanine N-acetyltransferase